MPGALDEFLSEPTSLSNGLEEVRGGTIILRPFQVEAYESWVRNNCRGTVIAPTGTGKTIIAGYAISQLNIPTLIICPTERILKMLIDRLREKFCLLYTSDAADE